MVGLAGIYQLAKCFLSPLAALMATAFQLGVIFYTFAAVEFNVNVVSLALWPWTAYFFWKAYQEDRLKHWLMFGVLMALNILNKYVGSVLGMALFMFVILYRPARSVLKNPKAYLAGCTCVLGVLPHLVWLYQHDFEMFSYIAGRNSVGKIKSVARHVIYPVKFLLAQVFFALPAGATLGVFACKTAKMERVRDKEKEVFLLCIGIIPTAFWMVSSLISGNALKSMD